MIRSEKSKMADIRILIGDTDKRYIMALERRFIDEYDGNCELVAVTGESYMSKLFSTTQSFDIMLVSEGLYSKEFLKHEIANIFILTENSDSSSEEEGFNVSHIYKYASVNEIYEQVSAICSRNAARGRRRDTEIISVYSPSGGSGKTTLAFALSAALSDKYKKVLYIGTDALQSFGCFMKEPSYLQQDGFENPLRTKSEFIADVVQSVLKEEKFYILPPFEMPLSSMNIGLDAYIFLARRLKEAGIFDRIVIDCDSSFSEDISGIMSISDKAVVLADHSRTGFFKLGRLLANFDCSDSSKFTLICTKFRIEHEPAADSFDFFTAVPYVENADEKDYSEWAELAGIEALAEKFV